MRKRRVAPNTPKIKKNKSIEMEKLNGSEAGSTGVEVSNDRGTDLDDKEKCGEYLKSQSSENSGNVSQHLVKNVVGFKETSRRFRSRRGRALSAQHLRVKIKETNDEDNEATLNMSVDELESEAETLGKRKLAKQSLDDADGPASGFIPMLKTRHIEHQSAEDASQNDNEVNESEKKGDEETRAVDECNDSEQITTLSKRKRKPQKRKGRTCLKCNACFSKVADTVHHMKHKHNDTHVCTKCAACFDDELALIEHTAMHKPLLCEKCGSAYAHIGALQTHMMSCHERVRAFPCDYEGCDKWFFDKCNRKKHINQKHLNLRTFPCPSCSAQFKTSSALKVHVYAYHTDESEKLKLPCYVCKKVFNTHSHLKQHLTLHTNVKPFICRFENCNKKFRLTTSRAKHEMVHKDIRPYVCEVCDQSFTRKEYLRTHAYKHTGQKAYECTICKKTFTQKGNLTAHMSLHSDSRVTYPCDLCEKSFTFKSNLTKHKLSHHSNVSSADEEDSDVGNTVNDVTVTVKHHKSAVGKEKSKAVSGDVLSSTPKISVVLNFPNNSAFTKTEIAENVYHKDIATAVFGDANELEMVGDVKPDKMTLSITGEAEIEHEKTKVINPNIQASTFEEDTNTFNDIAIDLSSETKYSIDDNVANTNKTYEENDDMRKEAVAENMMEDLAEQSDAIALSADEVVQLQNKYSAQEPDDGFIDQIKQEVDDTAVDVDNYVPIQTAGCSSIAEFEVKIDPDSIVMDTTDEYRISSKLSSEVHDNTDETLECLSDSATDALDTENMVEMFEKSESHQDVQPESPGTSSQQDADAVVDLSTGVTTSDKFSDVSFNTEMPC